LSGRGLREWPIQEDYITGKGGVLSLSQKRKSTLRIDFVHSTTKEVEVKRVKKINLVEPQVSEYPEGMEGWKIYRIVYVGHDNPCVYSGIIGLPPHVNPTKFGRLLELMQYQEYGR